ncbi:MAG: chlorite dismutase, partial [Bdellovibrionota bacterium]
MPPPIPVVFEGGSSGPWRIEKITPVRGEGLPAAERLMVHEGMWMAPAGKGAWALRGVAGHPRYVEKRE